MSAPILVFAGPSLPPEHRPTGAPCSWRPPAQAGDLLKLLGDPPVTVCLIDGYFDAVPAAWHKEILLLIAAGVRVIGGASIGALRAAELDRHGMVGIGAIYRAFRDGLLTGDDEVALLHLPERHGWQAVSEPMVDVRATLEAAVRAGALPIDEARAVRAAAKAMHYQDRTWPLILEQATAARTVLDGFVAWLPTGKVRLKQRDALACLAEARLPARVLARPPVPVTSFMLRLARQLDVPEALLHAAARRAPP